MEILVIIGYSRTGKSMALSVVEGLGYFSMDSLPPSPLEEFIDLAIESPKVHKVAVVMDTRGGVFFFNLSQTIEETKDKKIKVSILFLSVSEDVTVARYKERRRPHPLRDSTVEGYRKGRQELESIRSQADIIIDIPSLSINQFRQRLTQELASRGQARLWVTINNFGFKHGALQDADIIFDARFLLSPYYIPKLKKLSDLNKKIQDFVLSKAQSQEFSDRLHDLLVFLVPRHIEGDKGQLVIGLSCTGGLHRPVAMTEALAERLEKLDPLIQTRHWDMESGD